LDPEWKIRQFATGPSLRVEIVDEVTGLAFDLTGATAVAHMYDSVDDAAVFTDHPVTVEDPTAGILRLDWDQAGDTDTAGTMILEFEVTLASGEIETYPQGGYLSIVIRTDLNGG